MTLAFAGMVGSAYAVGLKIQHELRAHSKKLFGAGVPLTQSAPETTSAVRTQSHAADDLVLVADGLEVEYLTREAANNSDMMFLVAPQRAVVVNRLFEGNIDFNQAHNIAFQPKTGNVYVFENHPNDDVFACLPDGADRDIETDGFIKIISLKETSAKPTGFFSHRMAKRHISPSCIRTIR